MTRADLVLGVVSSIVGTIGVVLMLASESTLWLGVGATVGASVALLVLVGRS